MPLTIFALRVADPDIRSELHRTLEAISSEFPGSWSLSLIDSQRNDLWELRLKAPDGGERVAKLSPEQHTARAVQNVLRDLRDSPKKSRSTTSPVLKSLRVQNLLSFDENSASVDLTSLNILIGPNGAGKSNFIEAIGVLHDAPKDFGDSIRETGGITEWLWKGGGRTKRSGEKERIATVQALVAPPFGNIPLRYSISFSRVGYQLEITDERVETERPLSKKYQNPFMYFGYQNGRAMISPMEREVREEREHRTLKSETISPRFSVLSQVKDPDQYPELTYVGRQFESFRLYRDWEFGIDSTARDVFAADLANDYLDEDFRNFGLMLNRLKAEPQVNRDFTKYLQLFYADAVDIHPLIQDGRVQVRLEEKGGFSTPAARLSDGTLRWLALLIILLNPNPAPLVCIEEPELGLHPDMIPTLASLLKSASTKMQLVITTHSADLVEEFTDHPECVLVCDKEDSASRIRRLEGAALASWLEKYSLGEIWRKGEIGGTRW